MAEEVLRIGIDPTGAEAGSARFQAATASASSSATGLAKAVGVAGAALAAYAGARQVGAAINAQISFDSAMKQSLAIMGDVEGTMRNRMAAAARAVGEEFNFAGEQAAEAFFFLASAGLDAEQSLAALPAVAEFARAGMFDLATATDLATDAQSALGLSSANAQENLQSMTRVTDVLVKANTMANATVEQFSTALTTEAGAAMKAFNVDVEEGVAVLAAFADQGLKGQRAGSSFSRMLRIMSTAAAENADDLERLGLSITDAEDNLLPLADIVEQLTDRFGDMGVEQRAAELKAIGFTARVQQVIFKLLGASDAIREYESGLREAAGTTGDVSGNQMKSLENRIGAVGEAFKNMRARMIESTEVVEKFVSAAEAIVEMEKRTGLVTDALKALGFVIAGLGVAGLARAVVALTGAWFSLIPAVTGASSALTLLQIPMQSLFAAMGPTGWLIIGLSAATAAWFAFSQRTKDAEIEAQALADALDRLRGSVSDLTEDQLSNRVVATEAALERNERILDQLRRRESELRSARGAEGLEEFNKVTDQLEAQEDVVDRLRVSLDAAREALEAFSGAGGGDGGEGGGAAGAAEIINTLNKRLEIIEETGRILGDRFDTVAARQDAYRAAVDELIQAGQIEWAEEVAERFLSIAGAIDAARRAAEEFREKMEAAELAGGDFGIRTGTPGRATNEFESGARPGAVDFETGAAREELASTAQSIEAVARAASQLGDDSSRAMQGVTSLARGVGQLAEGPDSFAGMGNAILAITQGLSDLIGSTEEAERAQRAYNDALRELRGLSRELTTFQQAIEQTISGGMSALEAQLEAMGLPDVLQEVLLTDMQETLGQLRDDVTALSEAGGEFSEVVRAINDAIAAASFQRAQTELRFRQELKLRSLLAQGRDEEAEAMRRQMEREEEIRRARERGLSEGAIVQLKAVQAEEELARAREEAARQAERAAEFESDLLIREAELRGDEIEAERVRLRVQAEEELARAEELLEAGTITEEMFSRLASVLEGEVAQAIEELQRRSRRAAQQMMQDLRVRGLEALGRSGEASVARLRFRQAREREEFEDAGPMMNELLGAVQGVELLEAEMAAEIEQVRRSAQRRLRRVDDQISVARKQLRTADDQLQTQERIADENRRIAQSLSAFTDELLLGPLTTLSPTRQLDEARRQFEAMSELALGGDRSAAESLPGAARALLEASREVNASGPLFADTFESVLATLENVRGRFADEATVAEQSLTELRRQSTTLESQLEQLQRQRASIASSADRQIAQIRASHEEEMEAFREIIERLLELIGVTEDRELRITDPDGHMPDGPNIITPGTGGTGRGGPDSPRSQEQLEQTNTELRATVRTLQSGFSEVVNRLERVEGAVRDNTDETRLGLEEQVVAS